jgi:protein-S-isoprenylcysteine O-methyltransferase Ste14
VFKYRGLLWGIFALGALIFQDNASPVRLAISAPVLVCGQILRFWAAGVIPKYRTLELDAPILVTWGPYAFVRNPLYAGNALMGCGWSVIAGWYWLAAFAIAYFAIYALVIIPYEEEFLTKRFHEEYSEFKSSTPSMIPNLLKLGESLGRVGKNDFDWKKSWSMERHSLRMNVVITALILARQVFIPI